MDITQLGGIKVSRSSPKVSVTIVNNREDISTALLYLRRVGEKFDLVEYTPTKVGVNYLEFTFDDLLFTSKFGRYDCRLVVAGEDRTSFRIHYVDDEEVSVRNA